MKEEELISLLFIFKQHLNRCIFNFQQFSCNLQNDYTEEYLTWNTRLVTLINIKTIN